MNFSRWQWRVAVILDVLIKASLIYLSTVLATLGLIIMRGFEPLIPILLMAASISSLHFLCLYFGNELLVWLEAKGLEAPGALKFMIVLILSNILFAVTFAAVLSINGNVLRNAELSALVAATNLIPVLIVVAVGCVSGVVRRLL